MEECYCFIASERMNLDRIIECKRIDVKSHVVPGSCDKY